MFYCSFCEIAGYTQSTCILLYFFLKSKSSREAMSKARHLYQFDMKLHYLDYSFFF